MAPQFRAQGRLGNGCGWLAALLLSTFLYQPVAGKSPTVSFNREIRPILADACFGCHGPDPGHREAGLRLDLQESALAALDSGNLAIVPGKRSDSELYRRISTSDPAERMPPKDSGKTLSIRQIEQLGRWIDEGAAWEPHWSLVAPIRPSVPPVHDGRWPRTPIDHFLLERLEAEGLAPSIEADRVTLIRRVYLDLIGLPPTPAQVGDFLDDASPSAYDKVVDTLLASSHFGERMAIHWLDLVRYADTTGFHSDEERAIWPYRDYVINAFNRNLRFDQFTIEQLAGDLLPNASTEQRVASAYNMLGMTSNENGIQAKEYLAKYAADRVRNVSSVWMAATMGCAECHDHKYDPYSVRDFYRLAVFFADIRERGMYLPVADLPMPTERQTAELAEIDKEIATDEQSSAAYCSKQPAAAPPSDVVTILNTLRRDRTEKQIARLMEYRATAPASLVQIQDHLDSLRGRREQVMSQVTKTIQTVAVAPRIVKVLTRGNWMDESGEVVSPGVPACLPSLGVGSRRATRLDLARWLVSREHPQTARVFVNRLWKLYFGTGLSHVLDDLGARGESPKHSDLLDWLAVEFVESGWDVKHVVRLLVTSSAYRQSSTADERHARNDPDNRWFGRQAAFRLEAELIRDNALAISGLLSPTIGGPSTKPYQPDGYYRHLNFPPRDYVRDTGPQQYRRGLYTHWQRSFLHPALLAFDAPSREECTAQRTSSNTPTAALVLLNDPSFVESARVLAAKTVDEGGADFESRLTWAWRRAVARRPNPEEMRALKQLFDEDRRYFVGHPRAAAELLGVGLAPVRAGVDPSELAAWTSVARAILNANETITRN